MPSSEPDLCYLTAGEALKLFAKRDLSPVELMQTILRRIELVNPKVNAFGDCFFDEAIADARRAEARWIDGTARAARRNSPGGQGCAARGGTAHDLWLAALSRKFCSSLRSDDRAAGSCRRHHPCPHHGLGILHLRRLLLQHVGPDAQPLESRLQSGRFLRWLGRCAGRGHDDACDGHRHGRLHPRSRLGLRRRRDSSPRTGATPMARLSMSTGSAPAVRSHAAPWTSVSSRMSLPARIQETTTVCVKSPAIPKSLEEIAGLRVAWSLDLGYRAVHPDVRVNTERAIALLRDLGCRVEAVELGWDDEIDRLASDWYRLAPAGQMLASAVAQAPDLVSAELVRMVRSWPAEAPGITPVLALVHRMSRDFANVMASHDVFVCPTMSVPAVRADQSMWDDNFEIAGKEVDPEFGYSMTHQFNLLGNCPVISVPSGLSRDGVPTGIQIVGRPFDDLAVIRAALAFEMAGGIWYSNQSTRPKL